ncbi:SAM-dependent methyltransferase [Haloplanus sp. GCM10025708]|uniref:SAM-dependent methyltransferase n=1 Tax=Haloferacaceae TaxID=1644056 RepID=UPI0036191937
MAVHLEPIGRARTPLATPEDAPRQGFLDDVEGRIELETEYAPGLEGVEAGDELVVVWYADEADSLVRVDRDGGRGVFTTRSPARPNAVCLTTCPVVAVEGATLRVRGVDMADGSPVLDLKPPL